MKMIAANDRPREKLDRLGVGALGDNELLAIVMGQGTVRQGALDLANRLLDTMGGLHGLTRASRGQLQCLAGVGSVKAAQVLAAVELGRRTLVRPPPRRVQLVSAGQIAAQLLPEYGSRAVEHSGVMLLDTKHRLLRTKVLSVGSIDTSVLHPREVYREAAIGGAAVIVVFHNHPSGDPKPSTDDAVLTERLAAAGEVIGIRLLDHVILADSRYYSFRAAGLLDRF